MSDSLIQRAAQAHEAAEKKTATDRLAKFAGLLKDQLGLDATPAQDWIEIDGVVLYLEGQRLKVEKNCPICKKELPGNFVGSLAELGAELKRPPVGHACTPVKKATVAEASASARTAAHASSTGTKE